MKPYKSKKTNLAQLMDWVNSGDYPEWAESYVLNEKFLQHKRNNNLKPILFYDDLHEYAKDCCEKVLPFIPNHVDIFITGSWVNGSFSHPEHNKEYSELRKKLNKPEISDLDFYIEGMEPQEARKLLWDIGDKIGKKIDFVQWWGTGINLRTYKVRACNPLNRLGGNIKKKYNKFYTEEELKILKFSNHVPR